MKPKTAILLVVAVVCGLGASYMTSQLLANRSGDSEKVQMVVAKKNINMGESIKIPEALFEFKSVTKGEQHVKAYVVEDGGNMDKLKNKILKRPLRAGDYISLEEDTYDQKDPNSGLQVTLPPDMVAIGIRVTNESSASGFANLPLSRVDIHHTVRRGDDKSSYSHILLENVLVLAADQGLNRPDAGAAISASIVTVALTREDALKVNVARDMGSLSFVVRKFGDNSKANIMKVTVEDVKNGTYGGEAKDKEPTDPLLEPMTSPTQEPLAALPGFPKEGPIDAEPMLVVKKEEVKIDTKKHILRIIEGDKERAVEYNLDKNGQVPVSQVTKTELTEPTEALPTPPRPTVTPQGPTPATAPEMPEKKNNF